MNKTTAFQNFYGLQLWFATFHPEMYLCTEVNIPSDYCEIRVYFDSTKDDEDLLIHNLDMIRLVGTVLNIDQVGESNHKVLTISFYWDKNPDNA